MIFKHYGIPILSDIFTKVLNGRGRRTFDGWIETVKSIEFNVAVRLKQLADGDEFKTKNPDSVKADKIFESLVMKHKSGQLNDNVKNTQDNRNVNADLPVNKKSILTNPHICVFFMLMNILMKL